MTSPSAASTLADSRSWQLPSTSPTVTVPAGASVPPRWASTSLAPDDQPQGRILLVENHAILALDLQRTLRNAGYRVVGPATKLCEIQSFLDRGSIDCAVLDVEVDLRTPLPVADLLTFADIPFVFLAAGGRSSLPQRHAHRPLVRKPFVADELLLTIRQAIDCARTASHTPTQAGRYPANWPRVLPQL